MRALWDHQHRGIAELTQRIRQQARICITSPTGGGKSTIMSQLIERATRNELPGICKVADPFNPSPKCRVLLLTHRKQLLTQLSRGLEAAGIDHGIRAAEHEWRPADVQLSMVQTEDSRVFKRQSWELHDADLVIVDECHALTGPTVKRMVDHYMERSASLVGFTATPLDLEGIYSELVVAGTNSELRKCGAHVPAYTYGPDEPDTRDLKPQKTGEYSEGDNVKAIMTPVIFGRVFENWKLLNPHARPALLFGPGVAQSQWFCEQFMKRGVSAAHIDATHIVMDGVQHKKTQELYDELLERSRTGDIKVICNRFVMREGLDMPWLYHGIFATMFGLSSYLQAGGRILRAHSTLDHVIIQDHGGNWHRHGSLNADREWNLGDTSYKAESERAERIRENREPEPIVCPKCSAVRLAGAVCPKCQHETTKRSRMVIQRDGEMRELSGKIYRPRVVREKPDTERKWEAVYHRCRKAKSPKTFRQARGLFFRENGYFPPDTIPLMPQSPADWYRRVSDVPMQNLTPKG